MRHAAPLTALLAGLVLASAGCGGDPVDKSGGDASRPLELVLAHHDDSRQHVQSWADAVERLSGGTIEVKIAIGWRGRELDYEAATLGDVRSGKVDIASVAARAFDAAGVTSFQPLEAPLLVDSDELETEIVRGEIGRTALEGTAKLGVTGLALLPTELRRPVGLTRRLADPADWRGARVYTREGDVARRTLEALGAEPVRHTLEDWHKDVDGAELGVSGLKGEPDIARDAAGMTSNVVLWPQLLTLVINRKVFDGLSSAQKSALMKAGSEAFEPQVKVTASIADENRDVLCQLGVKLVDATPAQLAALRRAVEPVYAAIEKAPGNREAIAAIRALKGDAEPEAFRCPAGARPAKARSKGSARLAGTFRTTLTEKELASSKLLYDDAEINDENWGDITITMTRDGRLNVSQKNRRNQMTMDGTYSVDGDIIEMDVESLGETFTFRWSLYRDKLRFVRDEKLGVAPTPFLIKSFTRVR